jgi:NADH-quinone oxidoreductase subunit A
LGRGGGGGGKTESETETVRQKERRKENIMTYIMIIIIILFTLIMSNIINVVPTDNDKLSPYECGFEPLGDARQKFDVSYYLIAILFILFDLEILFLLPFASVLHYVSYYGFWIAIVFIIILTVGFLYEYVSGAIKSPQSKTI